MRYVTNGNSKHCLVIIDFKKTSAKQSFIDNKATNEKLINGSSACNEIEFMYSNVK